LVVKVFVDKLVIFVLTRHTISSAIKSRYGLSETRYE